jgi:Flp pilus assembly protein TadG
VLIIAAQDRPMSSQIRSRTSFLSLLRNFRRNREGDAVVQFALVAPAFFALLFAIVETALMFLASQVLETITQDSARLILTGQAQTEQLPPALATACPLSGNQTAAQFKCMVCQKIPALFNCNNIYVDVESYPSFAAINISNQIDGNGNFVNNMQYNPGGPGDIVVVRLFYQWPLFVTGLGYNISNMSGNQRLLVATAAFENEPYN